MTSHGVPRVPVAEEDSRTEDSRQEEQRKIKAYRDLIKVVESKHREKDYTAESLHVTSRLLKENPEYYTIWNIRRQILIHGFFPHANDVSSSLDDTATKDNTASGKQMSTTIDILRNELDFILPLMISSPKCYWIWKYRLWLLEQGNKRLKVQAARELWLRELGFVAKMLTKDKRNFHGWGYRRSVVAQLESPQLDGESMVEQEFDYSTRMIHVDLRNFSAWHHRSKLIPRLLDERGADSKTRTDFLAQEFKTVLNAIWTDQPPYDQSVWFYHQYLMTNVTEPNSSTSMVPNFTSLERGECIQHQIDSIVDFLDGGEDCKWAYIALIDATLAMQRLQERRATATEQKRLLEWLDTVAELDPMRKGRWADMRTQILER